MNSFQTIYDINTTAVNATPVAYYLIVFTAICLLLFAVSYFCSKFLSKETRDVLLSLLGLFSFFGIIFCCFLKKSDFRAVDSLSYLKERNLIDIVKGRVNNYKLERLRTKSEQFGESFNVDSVGFSFVDATLSHPGYYSTSQPNGGIIRENIYVQITYLKEPNNHPILKLEILK